jgi:aconitase A
MCSEYGSLIGYFPLDELTMEYLSHTGRDKQQLRCIEAYMKRVGLFRPSSRVMIPFIIHFMYFNYFFLIKYDIKLKGKS